MEQKHIEKKKLLSLKIKLISIQKHILTLNQQM